MKGSSADNVWDGWMDGKLISINGPLYCIFYNVEEPVQEFGAIKETFGWSPVARKKIYEYLCI